MQAIGCLQKEGSSWVLGGSTEPRVTTRDPLSPADKEALAATPPGTATIELIGIYPEAALVQNTVLVKGLFISRPERSRINVTSTELLHLKCGQ